MPAIEGYIGNCHPENSTVDGGVSLNVVKLNHTQQTVCLL
jgi:hypothetical protein